MNNSSWSIIPLLKRELRFMFRQSLIKYLVIVLFVLFSNIIFVEKMNIQFGKDSFNLFFELFKGVGYCIRLDEVEFPIFWFLTNIFIIYIIGDYFQKDYNSNAIYIVTRCGKKRFWISKVMVSIVNVLVYYLIVFSSTFIVGKVFNNQFIAFDYQIIVLYIMTSIMLVVFNSCISLSMDFKYSFLIITTILILSVFQNNSFLAGQHSLILRHLPYDIKYGLSTLESVMYNIVLSVNFLIIGLKMACKKEIK